MFDNTIVIWYNAYSIKGGPARKRAAKASGGNHSMKLSEDGHTLIATPLDECLQEARDMLKEWLRVHPGELIVPESARSDLAHSIAWALWKAGGSKTL